MKAEFYSIVAPGSITDEACLTLHSFCTIYPIMLIKPPLIIHLEQFDNDKYFLNIPIFIIIA